jgi:processive 1,2-diacylglycerol beta-glucosyltransferase
VGDARRILILHASAGAGHKRAAEALERGFRVADPASRVHALDTLTFASRFFQRTYAQTYDALAQRAPRVWGLLYWGSERPRIHRGTYQARLSVDQLNLRRLVYAIDRFQPAAIICTHFLPLEALAPRVRSGRLGAPLYCVITNFGIHPFWIYDGIHGYFVAAEGTRSELSEWGVPWEAIHVTGIPIDPHFAERQETKAARAALGLVEEGPVVLIMGGGNGVGPLHGLTERLLSIAAKPHLVVISGRNEDLKRRIDDLARHHGARVRSIGFTTEVDRWFDTADVIVTKAGGLTCSEALAKQVPLVVYRPTPGQEERNSQMLTAAGAALRARTLEQVAEGVQRILSHPTLARSMRQACAQVGRPRAAETVAGHVLAELQGRSVSDEPDMTASLPA